MQRAKIICTQKITAYNLELSNRAISRKIKGTDCSGSPGQLPASPNCAPSKLYTQQQRHVLKKTRPAFRKQLIPSRELPLPWSRAVQGAALGSKVEVDLCQQQVQDAGTQGSFRSVRCRHVTAGALTRCALWSPRSAGGGRRWRGAPSRPRRRAQPPRRQNTATWVPCCCHCRDSGRSRRELSTRGWRGNFKDSVAQRTIFKLRF